MLKTVELRQALFAGVSVRALQDLCTQLAEWYALAMTHGLQGGGSTNPLE